MMQKLLIISRAMIIISFLAVLIMAAVSYFLKHGNPFKHSAALKCTFKKDKAMGIIFGKKGPAYYFSPTAAEGHIFVSGGSGTGKTSALLIPTLQAWNGTSFVIDISGDISENVEIRRKLIYEPMAASSAPYNILGPIDDLPDDADRVEALAQLAWLIMPELQNSSANADYYQNGGRAILTASLIWGYHVGLDFIDICETITDNSYTSLFNLIDQSKDAAAIRYINQFEGNASQNTAGCKQNADRAVELFSTNERVKRSIHRPAPGETALCCSSVEDHSVFVLIPDARLELLGPLLHIITAQLLNYLADRPAENKSPILLALDEFVSLGKLEIGPALRKLRKKRIRIMVLTQSMADIDELYTRDTRMSMLNNFAYKVILSAGDTDTQRYYADLIGQEEKTKTSITSGSFFSGHSTTETKSTERGYIIEPAALANLGNDLILLYPGGYRRLRKNFYFK